MHKVRELQGTPCHIVKLHRKLGDDRRHKSKCIYHNKDNFCSKALMKCAGSAHCSWYKTSKNHITTFSNMSHTRCFNKAHSYNSNTKNKGINYSQTNYCTCKSNKFKEGMLVYSPKYGTGKIIKILLDAQNGNTLLIDFHGTEKQFLERFIPEGALQIIPKITDNTPKACIRTAETEQIIQEYKPNLLGELWFFTKIHPISSLLLISIVILIIISFYYFSVT